MTFDSHTGVSRRAVLLGALGAVLAKPSRARAAGTAHAHGDAQQTASQDAPVGRLGNPWVAGQPRERPTEFDNDPYVISLENRLKCNCGCAHSLYACRTTDFSCQFWQPLHAEVVDMVQQNMTAEEIIDAYVTKHGTQYLMAPPAKGFNLAGYLVPGVLISLTAAGMAWLLQRKNRVAAAPIDVTTPSSNSISAEEEARLANELNKLQL